MSRSKLSEVKASTEIFILSSESLKKILEVAGNRVEVLEYFQTSLKEKIARNPDYEKLLLEVDALVNSARYQDDEKNKLPLWSGKSDLPEILRASFDKSEFTAFQEFLVSQEIGQLKSKSITMDYAVNEESAEYLRGYSGDNLTDKDIHVMDTLFNAWLSKQDMTMQGGIVYVATKDGEPVKNADSKNTAKNLNNLFLDKELGFAAYVAKSGAKIELTLQKRVYPTPTQQDGPS